jgi:hypothetical protein
MKVQIPKPVILNINIHTYLSQETNFCQFLLEFRQLESLFTV